MGSTMILTNLPAWISSATYTIAVGILLFVLLGVAARRGDGRLPWIGASLFGWGYFIFVFWWGSLNPPDLFPSMLSHFLHHTPGDQGHEIGAHQLDESYRQISDSFVTLLAACFGSLVSLALAPRTKPQEVDDLQYIVPSHRRGQQRQED